MFTNLDGLDPRAVRKFKEFNMEQNVMTDQTILAWSFMIEYMLKNMHLPGQIENWVMIWDVNKLGITEIPAKLVGKIVGWLSDNYRCKTRRMFILNTTLAVKMAWSIVQAFLREPTRKKISLTNKSSDPELFERVDHGQIGK